MQYKVILAAINEHLNSEIAGWYAMNLARVCGARLIPCFIAERGMSAESIDRATEAVKRLFERALAEGIEVQSIAGTGSAVVEIGKIARREKADIVFASTRREDLKRRFYSGTVARSLVSRLNCSVAIVRVVNIGRAHPHEILVPVKSRVEDLKERAYFASKIAESFSARLFLLHATQPVTKFLHGEIHLTPAQWDGRMGEDMRGFMEQVRQYGVEVEGKLSPGRSGPKISLFAAAKRHDLIIMGASQRSFLASLIRGNPMEEVLRDTPCNMIMLKSGYED